ncbi:MAG: hypothetical protein HZA22_11030 [Nitrospirae bacterium]|nr:hypothetical protein [Nitrospirota bacterium]MBI5695220.1 hypothetical protein [Nitrospirota bacterium]
MKKAIVALVAVIALVVGIAAVSSAGDKVRIVGWVKTVDDSKREITVQTMKTRTSPSNIVIVKLNERAYKWIKQKYEFQSKHHPEYEFAVGVEYEVQDGINAATKVRVYPQGDD